MRAGRYGAKVEGFDWMVDPISRKNSSPAEMLKRHPTVRLLAGSLSLSSLGNWFYNVALVTYVFESTRSAGWVAAAGIARLAPNFLAPLAGALADRSDRVRLMAGSDLARSLLMFVLASVIASSGPPGVTLLIAALSTALGTVYAPCMGSLIPHVVADEELPAANTVLSGIDSLALLLGPALGAVVVLVSSTATAIAFNGLTFLGSAALVCRVGSVRGLPRAAAWRLMAGFRVLAFTAQCRRLIIFFVAHDFLYGLSTVFFVLISEELLGLGSNGVGWLYSAIGLGGIITAGNTHRLPLYRTIRVLILALFFIGTAMAGLAFVDDPIIACLLLLLDGTGTLLIDVIVVTKLQLAIPDSIKAGATGALEAVTIAAIIAGTLVAPALVDAVGLRWALILSGVCVPVVTITALLVVLSLRKPPSIPELNQ